MKAPQGNTGSTNDFPFAHRTDWRQETNALNKVLEDLQARHIPVFDLTASNPTNCGFTYPDGLLSALSLKDNLHYYPDACGMEKARRAVAKYSNKKELDSRFRGNDIERNGNDSKRSGNDIRSGDIILTASTSEAYSFLMRLLVNPGERVLIPKPSYPLFQFLLEINDVEFDHYPLVYDGQWRLDQEALKHLVKEHKPKAIILVNPNNPTGSYLTLAELNFLNELCREHHIAIISDEVFFDYHLSGRDIVSCAGNQAVLTFALGGLSKTLALPQMKCAWIAASGPSMLLQESLSRLEIIADTYLSVNTPVQNALSAWLDYAPQIQAQIVSRVKENWQWLKDHLAVHTELLDLQGGWYATLRIPAVKSEEEWVLEFLKEDHVSVYPGYFFDFDREAYIVLSLLVVPADFKEAAARIMKRLEKYS
jgi:aspartate/methionine/tyrosine aminotransferase